MFLGTFQQLKFRITNNKNENHMEPSFTMMTHLDKATTYRIGVKSWKVTKAMTSQQFFDKSSPNHGTNFHLKNT